MDSSAERELQLFVSPGGERQVIRQNVPNRPVQWAFDRWFKITVAGNLTGNDKANVTIWQDDTKLIEYVGPVFPAGQKLKYAHFGLYTSNKQGTFAVYNDDLSLWSQE